MPSLVEERVREARLAVITGGERSRGRRWRGGLKVGACLALFTAQHNKHVVRMAVLLAALWGNRLPCGGGSRRQGANLQPHTPSQPDSSPSARITGLSPWSSLPLPAPVTSPPLPPLQVGNFRVEPPGLFRGRGEHPRMGKIKRRVYPRDITINIGAGEPVPTHPFPGQTWKEVRCRRHDEAGPRNCCFLCSAALMMWDDAGLKTGPSSPWTLLTRPCISSRAGPPRPDRHLAGLLEGHHQ